MADDPLQNYDGLDIDAWANQSPQRVAKVLVHAANLGHPVALRWVRRLLKHGVTNSLLADVDRIVRAIPWGAFLILKPGTRKFEWRLRVTHETMEDLDEFFAYMVAELVTVEGVDRLKRCALADCRKYFAGGPLAKWCSENCGSKFRVREKRRKDRERQML